MRSLLIALFSLVTLQAQTGIRIVNSARKQIGVTVRYDPAYTTLSYPGGDVPADRGVCTDVVIRSMRDALSRDLQQLLHEDMRENFAAYPRNWRLARPDKNIDHRRVLNLQTWFKRKGYLIPLKNPRVATRFLAGDIVTCTVPPHLPHIMIVSDRVNEEGVPLIIHNIGSGSREEDRLLDFPLTGHYRIR